MNELDLFIAANAISDPAERAAYLDQACADEPQLRQRLEALLARNAQSQHPLDEPPSHPPAPADHPRHLGDQAKTGTFQAALPPEEAEGTVIAGRYKLRQLIGEGGMGTVWMADQTEPVKRKVAVKLIRVDRGQSKKILARFEAERQAIALMDHPHIARLLDAGTTDNGSPFFVMELVKGIPLNEFCDQHRLTFHDRLGLFTQICSAVQHAHQKGIIHRDLKPSNILVESHDGQPVPKVIDFGLAKATTGLQLTDQSLFTGFGTVMGTPLYMAPEQASFNALDVDTRADVYALGVILYELLTGTTPITRDTLKKAALDEMLKLIRDQEAPTPSSRLSSAESAPSVAANRQIEPAKLGRFVKGELDWIVLKALSKDRNRRYETANGFARDIERFLAHEPVQAGPPSASYRFKKFVQRNRGQVIAASFVLLALVAGMAGTTIGLVRANRAAHAERLAQVEAHQQAQKALAAAEEERKAKGREAERAEGERRAKAEAEAAAAAEKLARQQAQRRLEQVEKGVELFAGMLQGINPRDEEQGGEPLYMQLRERAEAAADALNADAVGDPLSLARLQTTLGGTLTDLGSTAKAIEVLEKARDTRQHGLGPDAPDTLVTLMFLAGAYQDAGRLPEAIAIFEYVRDRRVKGGPENLEALATLNNLALAYLAAGRLPEAIMLFQQVCDARLKILGADHSDTLITLGNLAGAYQTAGNLLKAMEILEQVRDVRVQKLGAEHPVTLITLGNLSMLYREVGRFPDAFALGTQVRDARVKQLGSDHPATLAALANLGWTYLYDKREKEAVPLFEQVRNVRVKQQGADHPDTLNALTHLALAYREVGRVPEAIALFQKVRDARLQLPEGADHPNTLDTLGYLAGAYLKARMLPEAIELLQKVRDAKVQQLGAEHPHTLATLNDLAVAYQDAGRLPEAIAIFEQAAAGLARRQFQDWRAGAGIANTIAAYEKAGQLDQAEGWRRRWLAVVKERSGAESPAYAAELAGLGQNLLRQKKWADAEVALLECLAVREQHQPDDPRTFIARSLLGGALLGQKKYAKAEPLLLQGYEGLKARQETIPPAAAAARLPEALDRLIELYTATNQPDEAQKYRELRAEYPFEPSP